MTAPAATLAAALADAARECAASPTLPVERWIRPYTPADTTDRHQFLVMLKPELMRPPGGDPTPPIARVLGLLAAGGVEIGAVRVLSSAFVAEHAVVESHYPALNRIARRGLAGMSPAALDRLDDACPGFRAAGGRVVGAFPLLDEIAELTPFALELLTRNSVVVKLGTGTYAIRAWVDGEELVVLNPFHPQQVAHFTTPGGAIALLECRAGLALPRIRRDLIGATDPAEAAPGSVKGVLYRECASLGLGRVSTRRNGVHVSPGAVEGMATMLRYFSVGGPAIRARDTVFGRRLLAAGLTAETVAWAASDPFVDDPDRPGPLFELTEDLDWADAVAFVTALERP